MSVVRQPPMRTTYRCTCGHRHHITSAQAEHLPVESPDYERLRRRGGVATASEWGQTMADAYTRGLRGEP